MWTNLIDNAIDAMSTHGELKVRALEEGGLVHVTITDNGLGIPPELQARIFEPFFTAKKGGQDTGLGLDFVSRIVQQHKAEIKVSSVPGTTTFTVSFPPVED